MLNPSPEVQELMKALTGMPWPSINEDELRRAAQLYEATSDDFDVVRDELTTIGRYIRENFSGEAAQTFAHYAELLTGGDAAALAGVKDQAATLARIADDTAVDAEYVKWMIIAQMIELIAEMLFEAAVFWVPGLGQAVAAHVSFLTMLVRLLVPRLVLALVKSIATHTVISIAMGLAMDALIQGLQMSMGRRDEWNTDLTLQAVTYGAFQGLVGGPLALLGAKVGTTLGRKFGNDFTKTLTDQIGDALAKGAGSGRRARRFSGEFVETLGGMNAELVKGLNKSAKETASDAFVRSVGDQFVRAEIKGLSKDQARSLGETWAKTVAKEWSGTTAVADVKKALRTELSAVAQTMPDSVGPLVRTLADEVPDAMSKAGVNPSKGFLAALYATDMLTQGISENLAEGGYNLITTGEFTTSGGTFLAGVLTTGVSHAGRHFVVQPLMTHFATTNAAVNKVNDFLLSLDGPEHGFLPKGAPTTPSTVPAVNQAATANATPEELPGPVIKPTQSSAPVLPVDDGSPRQESPDTAQEVIAPSHLTPLDQMPSQRTLSGPAPSNQAPANQAPSNQAPSSQAPSNQAPPNQTPPDPTAGRTQPNRTIPDQTPRNQPEQQLGEAGRSETAEVPGPPEKIRLTSTAYDPEAPSFGDGETGPQVTPGTETAETPSSAVLPDGVPSLDEHDPQADHGTPTETPVHLDDIGFEQEPPVPQTVPFVEESGPPDHLYDISGYLTDPDTKEKYEGQTAPGHVRITLAPPPDTQARTATGDSPGLAVAKDLVAKLSPELRAEADVEALARLLDHETRTLIGDGHAFIYTERGGDKVAVLQMKLGREGLERREETSGTPGQPYKTDLTDGAARSVQKGLRKSAFFRLGLSIPGSVSGVLPFSAGVARNKSLSHSVSQISLSTRHRETRAAEATRSYLSGADITLTITPLSSIRKGTTTGAETVTVPLDRQVRLEVPVSADRRVTAADVLPKVFDRPPGSRISGGHVEGVGSMKSLADWALGGKRRPGAGSGGQHGQTVLDFFSSRNFQQQGSRFLLGELTPPRGHEVSAPVLGSYRTLSASSAYELRNTDVGAQRTEIGRSSAVSWLWSAFLGIKVDFLARAGGKVTHNRATSQSVLKASQSARKTVARTKGSLTAFGLQEVTFDVTRPDGERKQHTTWILVREAADDVRRAAGYDTGQEVSVGTTGEPDIEVLKHDADGTGERRYDLSLARVKNVALAEDAGGKMLAQLRKEYGKDVLLFTREELLKYELTRSAGSETDRMRYYNTALVLDAMRPSEIGAHADQMHNGGRRLWLVGSSSTLGFKTYYSHTLVLKIPDLELRYEGGDPRDLNRIGNPGQTSMSQGTLHSSQNGFGLEMRGGKTYEQGGGSGYLSGDLQDRSAVASQVTRTIGRDNLLVTTKGAHQYRMTGQVTAEIVGRTENGAVLKHLFNSRNLPTKNPVRTPFTAELSVPDQLLPPRGTVREEGPPWPTRTPDLSTVPALTTLVRPNEKLLRTVLDELHKAAGEPRGMVEEGTFAYEVVYRALAGLTAHSDELFSPEGYVIPGLDDIGLVHRFEHTVRLKGRRSAVRPTGTSTHLEPEQNISLATAILARSGTERGWGVQAGALGQLPFFAQGRLEANLTLIQQTDGEADTHARGASADTNLVRTGQQYVPVAGDVEIEVWVEGSRRKGLAPSAAPSVSMPGAFKGLMTPAELVGLDLFDDGLGAWLPPDTMHGWSLSVSEDKLLDLYPVGPTKDGQEDAVAPHSPEVQRLLRRLRDLGAAQRDLDTVSDMLSGEALRASVQAGITDTRRIQVGKDHLKRVREQKDLQVRVVHELLGTSAVEGLAAIGDIEHTRSTITTLAESMTRNTTSGAALSIGGRREQHGEQPPPLPGGGAGQSVSASKSWGSEASASLTETVTHLNVLSGPLAVVSTRWRTTVEFVDGDGVPLALGDAAGHGGLFEIERTMKGLIPLLHLDPPPGAAPPLGTTPPARRPDAPTTASAAPNTIPDGQTTATWQAKVREMAAANERAGIKPGTTHHVKRVHGAERVQKLVTDLMKIANGKSLASVAKGSKGEVLSALTRSGRLASTALAVAVDALALANAMSTGSAFSASGYHPPTVVHQNSSGRVTGEVTVHMQPRPERATVQKISDTVRLETATGSGYGSGGRLSATASEDTGFDGVFTEKGTYDQGSQGVIPKAGRSSEASGAHAGSVESRLNEKPPTGRALLIRMPVTVVAEVTSRHSVKEKTPFVPSAVAGSAELFVDMWVSETKAAEMGVIDKEDAVYQRLADAWTLADTAQTAVKDNYAAYQKARTGWFDTLLAHRLSGGADTDRPTVPDEVRGEIERLRLKVRQAADEYGRKLRQAVDLTEAHQAGNLVAEARLLGAEDITASLNEHANSAFDQSVRHDADQQSSPPQYNEENGTLTLTDGSPGVVYARQPHAPAEGAGGFGDGLFHALLTDSTVSAMSPEALRDTVLGILEGKIPDGFSAEQRTAVENVLAFYHPDVHVDRFGQEELTGPLFSEITGAPEFKDWGHIPYGAGEAVRDGKPVLSEAQLKAMAQAQAGRDRSRPHDEDAPETHLLHAAADLYAPLAAIVLRKDVTVLSGGRRYDMVPRRLARPDPAPGGPRAEQPPVEAAPGAPGIIVLLDGGTYYAVTPVGGASPVPAFGTGNGAGATGPVPRPAVRQGADRVNLPIEADTDALYILHRSPEAGVLYGALRSEGRAPGLANLKEGGRLYVVSHDHQMTGANRAIDRIRAELAEQRPDLRSYEIFMIVCQAASLGQKGGGLTSAESFALTSGSVTYASENNITLYAHGADGEIMKSFPDSWEASVELGEQVVSLALVGDFVRHTERDVFDDLAEAMERMSLNDPPGAGGTTSVSTVEQDAYDVLASPGPSQPLPSVTSAEWAALLDRLGSSIDAAGTSEARTAAEAAALRELTELRDSGRFSEAELRAALTERSLENAPWMLAFLEPGRGVANPLR
ncbi:hypothetical protein ACFVS9_31735 [Streptomyces sp. NPDC058008]|uniref:WXG100-like domain-containing protein n=1 Tax=Streptomyces sp. NPDC058008 TaxID=3346303 RepID=UPI0036E8402E